MAENIDNNGCSQRDSAEHEGYAKALRSFNRIRESEDRCKTNIRYMYLMDYETPSYRSFSYFINEELTDSVQGIFKAIMPYIEKTDGVDLQHLYIDGSKFEANANKYSWVK